MKDALICSLLFVMFLVSFVSADMLTPGFKPVEIKNVISNFNDFPDYYFVSFCHSPMGIIHLVDDGIVCGCYKYSQIDVYVIKKESADLDTLLTLIQNSNRHFNESEIRKYFNETDAILVLENVEHYKTVPISSTEEVITNYYEVNLSKVQTNPIDREVNRNNLWIIYVGVSVVALVVILVILLIRKRKNELFTN